MASPGFSPPPLDNTLGAVYIGVVVSSAIYGLTCLQTYRYYQLQIKDPVWLRCCVFILWILETLHSACIAHAVYFYSITHYGDYASLLEAVWSIILPVGVNCLTGYIVQMCFAWRVFVKRFNNDAKSAVTEPICVYYHLIGVCGKAPQELGPRYNILDEHSCDGSHHCQLLVLLSELQEDWDQEVCAFRTCYGAEIGTHRGSLAAILGLITFLTMPDNLINYAFNFILGKALFAKLIRKELPWTWSIQQSRLSQPIRSKFNEDYKPPILEGIDNHVPEISCAVVYTVGKANKGNTTTGLHRKWFSLHSLYPCHEALLPTATAPPVFPRGGAAGTVTEDAMMHTDRLTTPWAGRTTPPFQSPHLPSSSHHLAHKRAAQLIQHHPQPLLPPPHGAQLLCQAHEVGLKRGCRGSVLHAQRRERGVQRRRGLMCEFPACDKRLHGHELRVGDVELALQTRNVHLERRVLVPKHIHGRCNLRLALRECIERAARWLVAPEAPHERRVFAHNAVAHFVPSRACATTCPSSSSSSPTACICCRAMSPA
ncbi:hypothetical protein DFH07DRAFT_775634 [Mycena maculata]|uniref:Uncharacterized protein n=1 Tax=Mycena maculata TaxID=230809 RepID=A0AAD7IRM8_9AGAR|nr:hypothetical protein DFH07DRAFT_775634 [Mycena maculata]